MEVLWSDDGSTKISYEDQQSIDITYGVMALFFVFAEIWCIIATVGAIIRKLLHRDLSLSLFYVSLHLTLCCRLFFLLNGWLVECPQYLIRGLDNGTVLAKDLLALSFICRTVDLLPEEDENECSVLGWGTRIFIFVHLFVFSAIYLCYCTSVVNVWTLAIYCASAQTLYEVVFVIVVVKFIRYWRQLEAQTRDDPLIRWLLYLMILFIVVLALRILINIGEFFEFQKWLHQDNVGAFIAVRILIMLLTELFPTVYITVYLWTLQRTKDSDDDNQADLMANETK